jgi:hypothetical protein
MINLGKEFEQKFKLDFLRTMPNSTIDRIYDSVSGYKAISNVCDFIGYKEPNIYYIECKSHKGKSFPFSNLSQYDDLKLKVGIPGVRAGVVLWLYEYDKVLYVPISTVTSIKNDGIKSVSLTMLDKKKYNIIEIPSIKKRVYMDSDYSILQNLKDGE